MARKTVSFSELLDANDAEIEQRRKFALTPMRTIPSNETLDRLDEVLDRVEALLERFERKAD